VFIGGNWAYVQRYTSVKDGKSSSKVGYLFGILYLISPFIWMLPPMIYRVLNPDLVGLEAEGAYLMICKEVLPVGLLGLMIGGMIFATASSVNTSLNLASAVLTNDIFKPLRPDSSDKTLIRVARLTTMIFGIGTIGIAFMVPLAGGIVEVVLSIAAITGGALYMPAIWALFSQKQTGKSILIVTIISLLVNIIFKFFTPKVFDFALNRTEELILGIGVPFFLLLGHEIFGSKSLLNNYKIDFSKRESEDISEETGQNEFGIKVLGYSFISISLMFLILSFWGDDSFLYLIMIGFMIMVLGISLVSYANSRIKNNENNLTHFGKGDKK
jgi:Na+/proline symporter